MRMWVVRKAGRTGGGGSCGLVSHHTNDQPAGQALILKGGPMLGEQDWTGRTGASCCSQPFSLLQKGPDLIESLCFWHHVGSNPGSNFQRESSAAFLSSVGQPLVSAAWASGWRCCCSGCSLLGLARIRLRQHPS